MKKLIAVAVSTIAALALSVGTASADEAAELEAVKVKPYASVNAWGINRADVYIDADQLFPNQVQKGKDRRYRVVRTNPRNGRTFNLARGRVGAGDSDYVSVRLHAKRAMVVKVLSRGKVLAKGRTTGSNWWG